MVGLQVLVLVGVSVLVGGLVAARLRVAAPLVLLALGAAVGLVPRAPAIDLPPDVVLLLLLPALLHWEALTTSLREIRGNLRAILLISVGLVLAPAGAVTAVHTRWAWVGHQRWCWVRSSRRPTRQPSQPSPDRCPGGP